MGKGDYEEIGIGNNFLKGEIDGQPYSALDDFVVCEIRKGGEICSVLPGEPVFRSSSKKYLHATLVKTGVSTFEACNALALGNRLNYFNDVSFSGLKDTTGITAQKICLSNISGGFLGFYKSSNFFLKDISYSNVKLKTADHVGNYFKIRLRKVRTEKSYVYRCFRNFRKTCKTGLPNYYGPQRFGIRQNNHHYGKLLLKGKYEEFIFSFLTESKNEGVAVQKMRHALKENFGDWKSCLKIVPEAQEFGDEKILLKSLSRGLGLLESIKSMKLSSFFLHSYSSYLFNKVLSKDDLKGKDFYLYKIGKCARFDSFQKRVYEDVMKDEDIQLSEFENCPFNIDARKRRSIFRPKGFGFNLEKQNIDLIFSLGIGEYASLIVDCLVKPGRRKLN